MSAQVVGAGAASLPPLNQSAGFAGAHGDSLSSVESGMAQAFSKVRAPVRPDGPASFLDIVVPDPVARDGRRRMAFKIGVWVARELGLNVGAISADDLSALGRQTVIDHATGATDGNVLLAIARLEGKVDDATWESGDEARIAEQAYAFLRSEFQDEIDLYQALDGLAAEPPVRSRKEVACALLREQGIDPDANIDFGAYNPALHDVSASSAPLVRNSKAGEYYFNRDKLTADCIRRMKLPGGGSPSDEHIERMLRELPASLDARFTELFDSHQQRMSTLLATWLSSRVSLHARNAGIALAGAAVAISRPKMRLMWRQNISTRPESAGRHSESYGIRQSCGYLVSIQTAGRKHHCFVSSRTGAVHVLPAGVSVQSWLLREHALVFDDVEARAKLGGSAQRLFPSVTIEESASGTPETMRDWLPAMFRDEIEPGREAARGQTESEHTIDGLLDLIPFRAAVVAYRKGDYTKAIGLLSLDVLSLIPLIAGSVRAVGAAAKAARPWLSMGARLGGAAGRQGMLGARRLAVEVPLQYGRLKEHLARSAIQGWGTLRPRDIERVARALRPTAPRMADLLDGITRSRGAVVPGGVWRVAARRLSAAGARTADTLDTAAMVSARNLEGDALSLLPYGSLAGAYTQTDAAGARIGMLLVADSGGWLQPTIPIAILESCCVVSPDTIRILDHARREADGTIMLNGSHHARLGGKYVEVTRDLAASTAGRPIWRVVVPRGAVADARAHRLVYDVQEGLWRQADVPVLAGGGNLPSRHGLRSRSRIEPTRLWGVKVAPGAAHLARFEEALVASVLDASKPQADALRVLLRRLGKDPRGKAIMRAMSAHYELLGRIPEVVLHYRPDASQARPMLHQPVPGGTWRLDLEALRLGTTETAVNEFAAVYNNMTGLLQGGDPFEAMLAQDEPLLDPSLEQAWTDWLEEAPSAGRAPVPDVPGAGPRERVVSYLRAHVREMLCYGGLDRSTLKSALMNQGEKWDIRIDLSRRGVDSVPPLPLDTAVLVMSHNPVRDWRNLPDNLTVLIAVRTRMARLPAIWPSTLVELDVSGNFLNDPSPVWPPYLEHLDISLNRWTELPRLPLFLLKLVSRGNSLKQLPASFPSQLQVIDVSYNQLSSLPEKLPSFLKALMVKHNFLAKLPASWPADVDYLDVSENLLLGLTALPAKLRIFDLRGNVVEALPDDLPDTVEVILAGHNRLRRLPDKFPSRLRNLSVPHNAIVELPPAITTLQSGVIDLVGNPLDIANIPVIPGHRPGPTIFFAMLSLPDQRAQAARTLAQAVQFWWTASETEAQARWEVIGREMGTQAGAVQFSVFLDLLRDSVSYADPGFRAQVADLLAELSKPERKALLDDVLAICLGATESCEDRVTSAWNDIQVLRMNDDVRRGGYDQRVADVLEIALQMFKVNVLAEFAHQLESTRTALDEVGVYLSFVVKLRDSLDLTLIAPRMRFYSEKQVSADDLAQARDTVNARVRAEFDMYLVLDYGPWQSWLKRKDAQAYADAEEAAQRLLETAFEPRLQQAVANLGLDPGNTALLEDARKDLGPGIMRQIRYEAMRPLTERYRRPPGSATDT